MKLTFRTGANAKFPQHDYQTVERDGRVAHEPSLVRQRRWAELTIGRETVHVDLGWADDPDSLARQRAMENDAGVVSRVVNAEHPRSTCCVLCDKDPEDCTCE